MDSLRAFAMSLGLVLHASVMFALWTNDPNRTHDEPSKILHYTFELIHVFRMQLFFLVAGFFSLMVCQNRGAASYAKNRFMRIVVPFVLCVLLLQPLAAAHYLVDVVGDGESLVSRYVELLLHPEYILREQRFAGNWFWHFWFLHMLIYYIGTFLVGFVVAKRFDLKFRFVPRLLDLLSGKYGVLILTLVTFPCLMFSPAFGEVPTIGTAPDMVIYYGLFFTMGIMLFANQAALNCCLKSIRFHLIPFAVCLCILIPLIDEVRLKTPPEVMLQNLSLFTGVAGEVSLIGSFPVIQNPFNFTGLTASFDWYLMNILRAYTAWCGVFLSIALFKRFFSTQSALGRYAADSAYFIYLIHFPIQLIMATYLRDRIGSSIACFWICLLGSTVLCVILYHLTCRTTPIGILLSGRRYGLSITEEWNDCKALLKKRSVQLGVLLIAVGFFVADRVESRTERKLLFFSSRAEPEKIKAYVTGKTADKLGLIVRSGSRNAMHMVAHNMPKPRPDEKIEESVQLLLNAGLDPMSRDDYGQTPLHYAVRNGNKAALGMLLKAGADPNAVDTEYGSTPLHLAAALKADDMIQNLVTAGGDPKLARKNGENSMQIYEKFHSKPFPTK
ncbi:MAG: acyltransferase family protein [Verrucomicrobiota bacterium]|nr:acyltransferase family protein [Verrucomicrobiota bacterium]